jgi:hypothetical protein
MFTVKLCRGQVKRIVEAESVDIFPAGLEPGSDQKPRLRTSAVREISVTNGERRAAYYIANPNKPRPEGFNEEVELFDVAYIENSDGDTTEVIRAY